MGLTWLSYMAYFGVISVLTESLFGLGVRVEGCKLKV